jgi:hypothetical protein
MRWRYVSKAPHTSGDGLDRVFLQHRRLRPERRRLSRGQTGFKSLFR